MRSLRTLVLFLTTVSVAVSAQVTFDGVEVPKEKIIVFLFAGHSNMAGRCTPDDQTTHPRCWAYGANGHRYWEKCKDRIFNNSSGAGPATAFLKDLADAYPGYYFGVIQNANTQAGVRWHNGNANNRYWKGAGRYEELMGYARDLQGKVTFGGVVTMLGIMEATSAGSSYWNTFSDDFRTTINNIRSDLGLDATHLPVLLQDYEREACSQFDADGTGPKAIIAQNAQIPGKVSNSYLIATNGIPCPDQCHHFDLAGMRTWAGRASSAYINNCVWWDNVDSDPPTVPGNVRSGPVGETTAEVLWNASSDPSGVKNYTVHWGSQSKTVTGTQTTVTGLEPCTNYSFTVTATDNYNNTSGPSSALAVQTQCCTDVTPPSAPTGLSSGGITQTQVTVSWTASTDAGGIAGYEVYEGATLKGEPTGTSYTVTGLAAQTQYAITVYARDNCGNRSDASAALSVTTADRPLVAIPFKVNLGGSATGDYVADKEWQEYGDYGYAGTTRSTTVTTAVAGTDNDAVYQSVRYTECDGLPSSTLTFGYSIAVPNGTYRVTLQFADFWRTSVGGRTFNVNIEGMPLPDSPIDIFAAVGQSTAYDIQIITDVDDGVLDIQTGMVVSDPIMSGIIVEDPGELIPYVLTSPTNGAAYDVGDTLTITYTANLEIVQDANFEISDDEGETWYSLMLSGVASSSDADWGTYKVVVPAQIDGTDLGGKDWMLRIGDYDRDYLVYLEGTIHINNTAVQVRGAADHMMSLRLNGVGNRVAIQIPAGQRYTVDFTTLNGSKVRHTQGTGPATAAIPLGPLSKGIYLLRVSTDERTLSRRIMVQ